MYVISPTIFSPGADAVRSGRRILVGQAVPPGPRLTGHQAQLAHQGADQLRGTGVARPQQRGVDPPVTVRLVRQLENHHDQLFQFLPARCGRRLRPAPPLVIAGAGNPQPLAHLHDGVLGPATRPEGAFLRVDELVPSFYRYSLAKKAAAFPRNSRSSLSSRFSFSNSRSRARSEIVSGGSSPACACRYAFTQLRKVCSFTPISRAVDGIARDSSTTIRATCSLYSGVNERRLFDMTNLSSRREPEWVPCPEDPWPLNRPRRPPGTARFPCHASTPRSRRTESGIASHEGTEPPSPSRPPCSRHPTPNPASPTQRP